MKNVLVVYICTDLYNKLFEGFRDSLHNFLPDHKKTVMVLSDGITQEDVDKYNTDKITYHCAHIVHNPWPINTLLKMYYIDKFMRELNLLDDITHICYFNANSKIRERESEYWTRFEQDMDKYDLFITTHHYSQYRYGYDYIGKYDIQACFFMGSKDKMIELINDNIQILYDELKQNRIPAWHDETILQEYLIKNKNKYKILVKHFVNHLGTDDKEFANNGNIDREEVWRWNSNIFNMFKDDIFVYLRNKEGLTKNIKYLK